MCSASDGEFFYGVGRGTPNPTDGGRIGRIGSQGERREPSPEQRSEGGRNEPRERRG